MNINEREIGLVPRHGSLVALSLTVEGLGVIAVANAINAALDVVRATVNRVVGFALV